MCVCEIWHLKPIEFANTYLISVFQAFIRNRVCSKNCCLRKRYLQVDIDFSPLYFNVGLDNRMGDVGLIVWSFLRTSRNDFMYIRIGRSLFFDNSSFTHDKSHEFAAD